MDVVRPILRFLVRFLRLPKRVIERDDGKPYLERWYLFGEPGGLKYFPEGQRTPRWWQRLLTGLPCAYVHRFCASDADPELHCHPWREATSYVLAGGYREERYRPEVNVAGVLLRERGTFWQTFPPFSRNFVFQHTFHRVELLEEDAWTLFVTGPKVDTWGFVCAKTGTFWHWKAFDEERKHRKRQAILAMRQFVRAVGSSKPS